MYLHGDTTTYSQTSKLWLGRDANFANYFYAALSGNLRPGWNCWKVGYNSAPWEHSAHTRVAPFTYLGIELIHGTGTVEVSFDSIVLGEVSTPSIVLSFDDIDVSVINTAYPIMAAAGIKGTVYCVKDICEADANILAGLDALYADGWAICNHTTTHAVLTSLTLAQIKTELQTCETWLKGRGYLRSYNHMAYPGGYYNDTCSAALDQLGFLTGRSVEGNRIAGFPVDSRRLHCYSAQIGINSMKAYVDNCKGAGTSLMIYYHKILDVPGADPYATSTADFQTLINYIVASGVQCYALDAWWQALNA